MKDATTEKILKITKDAGYDHAITRYRFHEINIPMYAFVIVLAVSTAARVFGSPDMLGTVTLCCVQMVSLAVIYHFGVRTWERLHRCKKYIGVSGEIHGDNDLGRGMFVGFQERHGRPIMLVTYWNDPNGLIYDYHKNPKKTLREELDVNEMLLSDNPIIRKIGYARTRS